MKLGFWLFHFRCFILAHVRASRNCFHWLFLPCLLAFWLPSDVRKKNGSIEFSSVASLFPGSSQANWVRPIGDHGRYFRYNFVWFFCFKYELIPLSSQGATDALTRLKIVRSISFYLSLLFIGIRIFPSYSAYDYLINWLSWIRIIS